LQRRGVAVRAAKAGPDYIDPAFHAAATGSPSVNLDSWAMSRPLLDAMAAQATTGADVFVIEGVMGLFDGTNGAAGQRGATADLAAHFKLPVVLCSMCRARRNRRRPWCEVLPRTIRPCASPA
jgi:cobyrinic acid a,c-diamide synthase